MTVATFIAIKNAKQTRGAMAGAMGYVAQDEKTQWRGISLVAGHNCVPQSSYIEFLTTKKRFHKTEGRQFYHFVQSFARTVGIAARIVARSCSRLSRTRRRTICRNAAKPVSVSFM